MSRLVRPAFPLFVPCRSQQIHSRILPAIRAAATRRYASTTQEAATEGRSLVTRLKNLTFGLSIILGLGFGYLYITDTRSSAVHQYLVPRLIRWAVDDAEDAHEVGVRFIRSLHTFGLHPRERQVGPSSDELKVSVWDTVLDNPIAVSAGLDKKAEIPSALFEIGASIVEVGGITPRPQEGNPKPRVFRIPGENALINRYGLQSEGCDRVAIRLRQRVREFARENGLGIGQEAEKHILSGGAGVPKSLVPGKLLAVQVAKNKDTPADDLDAVRADYMYSCTKLAPYADIVTVNVSSPNTPGLRAFQKEEPLQYILAGVREATLAANPTAKIMVKCSPDEDGEADIKGICNAVAAAGIDGIVIGNTTRRRPDIPQKYVRTAKDKAVLLEEGGYSGGIMFERTLDLVKKYKREIDTHQRTQGGKDVVIFATGGITNGKQALQILQAGADVAMVYEFSNPCNDFG